MGRKFGHCVANWGIQNSYILPMKKAWQIYSPVFEVRAVRVTRWIMKLLNKEIDGEFNMYFQLQKISSGEEIVPFLGKCNLKISNLNENCFVYREEFSFSEVSLEEQMLKINRKNESDSMLLCNLCIKCKLFISFIGVEEEISNCSDIGIRELSQDLLRLFESKLDTDVTLEVRDRNEILKIEAHKPILRSRNKNLKKMLDSKPDFSKFVVEYFGHYEEWNNIIRFLYTANMKHVLNPPSEVYYAISTTYDIEPITFYYHPDELDLYSIIPTEKFAITCTISNFLTCEEVYLQSLQAHNDTLDTYWKIHFYPKSFRDEDDTCICIEIGGNTHKIVLVEIFVMNAHISKSLKLIHGEIADNKIYKGYLFEKRKRLKYYLQDGNLKLGFKIQMMNLNFLTEFKQYSDASIVACKPYSDEKNYSTFSLDMSNLYYERSIDDNVIFKFAGEVCFVHRCILSARAPFLYEKILKSQNVVHQDARQCVLNDLIYFLYSGTYNYFFQLENTFALYDIADKFKLKTLKQFLEHNLELKIHMFTYDNLQKLLEFSISRKLPALQICANRHLPL